MPCDSNVVTDNATEELDPALVFPGPIALVAGPGSGKTTRIARRIKHLVEKDKLDPKQITVITFTREAARNMKERLTPPPPAPPMPDVTLPLDQHPSLICTMHSLGWRIINENVDRLEMPSGCTLLPMHLRSILFEDAARLSGKKGAFGKQCADRKSKVGVPADDDEKQVFDAYRQILNACHAIDYDDQIILACKLLQEHKDIRKAWRHRCMNLLVDEYQDINHPQLEFIQLLSGEDASGLFAVGDDDQSIYGFRGAEPNYIREFSEHFDGGQIFAIPDCFRCQPHVIYAAHGFIETFNKHRLEKPEPKCIREEGKCVVVHNAPSDSREAQIIASICEDALHEGDVLVLMPKDGYAEHLKTELLKRRIAFDAPKARATKAQLIFSALRDWLADNANNLAFRELLAAVADGGVLGIPGPRAQKPTKIAEREEALTKISALWGEVFGGVSLRDTLGNNASCDEFYAELLRVADELGQATAGSPTDFGQRTFEALRPWSSSKRLLDYLATAPTDTYEAHDGDANLVRIMTMRHSKGLEAETVFVVGLEEGAFPGAEKDTSVFEEEARLFYVSMTRAKESLHLFHARSRSGGMTYKSQSFGMKPSPFLSGLPKAHHEKQYHQSAAKRAAKKS